MKTKTVIIASHEKDQSALFLRKRLSEIGQRSHIVNFGEFPNSMSSTLLLENTNSVSIVSSNGFRLTAESVKSIWWRRPQGPAKSLRTSLLQKYVQNESEIALSSSLAFLKNVLWISDPEATRVANRKPLQLAVARTLGFRVPETCISNDPQAVKRFLSRHSDTSLIMKPVGSSYVRLTHDPEDKSRKNKAIYTKIIDPKLLLENIGRVSNCPFILQEAVMKDSDIRVTVVGDRVFASEITVENNVSTGQLDWRHPNLRRMYSKHDLPKDLVALCIRLVDALELKFGCIDLGFSKKDGYSFFEVNPQGQWMPSEQLAGHPISLALACLLSR